MLTQISLEPEAWSECHLEGIFQEIKQAEDYINRSIYPDQLAS